MDEKASNPLDVIEISPEKVQKRLRALGRKQVAIALLGTEPKTLIDIETAFGKFVDSRCTPQELGRVPQWARTALSLSQSLSESELLASLDPNERHRILSRRKDGTRDKRLRKAFIDSRVQSHVPEHEIQPFLVNGWPALVSSESVLQDAHLQQEGQRIFSSLEELNIAFGSREKKGFGMQTSPEPFTITPEAWERTVEVGRTVFGVLQTANELYRDALNLPSTSTNTWLLKTLEGEAPDDVIQLQRTIVQSKTLLELTPFFFRLDQVRPGGGPVEFESWGSGLGFQHAVQNVMTPDQRPMLIEAVSKRFQEKTGRRDPTVIFIQHNQKQLNESEFFTRECSKQGVNMIPVSPSTLDSVDLHHVHAIKKPRLRALLEHPRGTEIVREWQDGKLVLEPPPNLLIDEKIILALPFSEQTRDCFSDDVRECLMPTWILEDETMWEIRKEMKRQDLILKYAGNDPRPRLANLGSHKLSNDDKSQSDEVFSMALDRNRRQSDRFPWVVQPRDDVNFVINVWDKKKQEIRTERRFARFNPAFVVDEAGTPQLVSFTANFNPFWRVGGGENTVTTAVTKKGGAEDKNE